MSGGASVSAEAYDVGDHAKMLMLQAAQAQRNDEVLEHIRNGVPVDAYDDDRVTALQIASATGNVQLINLLLAHGASVDSCNQVGMTAFHQACREGHLKAIEILLQHGANTSKATNLGVTAITLAAYAGHNEVVKRLINLHAQTTGCERYSPTPLIAAAFRRENNAVVISHLVKLGKANVHETAERLWHLSPLTCAVVCNSSKNMVACLLEMGADPLQKALKDRHAVWLASYQKRNEIIELFNEHAQKKNIQRTEQKDIRQLIIEGDMEKIEKAVHRNETSPEGVPPILFATLVGSVSALKHLLALHQPVDAVESKIGINALMVAALFRDNEAVDLLLVNDSNPSITNSLIQTAYDLFYVSTDEPDDSLRASLSLFNPKGRSFLKLSGNSSAFSKLFTVKQKLTSSSDREDSASSIRMRSYFDARLKTCTLTGWNHRKLFLADDVLKQKREMTKPKDRNSNNRFIDVARNIVEESTSFAMKCFYDHYNHNEEQRAKDSHPELPKDELDQAVYLSKLYGYRGAIRPENTQSAAEQLFPPQYTARMSHGSLISLRSSRSEMDVPRVRRTETTAGSTTANRTTPRMVKKSRESVGISTEDMRVSSLRSMVATGSASTLTPLDESSTTLRGFRSASTPQLQPRRPLHITPRSIRDSASAMDAVWSELDTRGFPRLTRILKEQEVDGWQFLNEFGEPQFREMGIQLPEELRVLIDVKRQFTQHESARL